MEIAVGTQYGRQRFGGDAHLSEHVAPGIALVAVADAFGGSRARATGHVALGAIEEVLRRRLRAAAADRSDLSGYVRNALLSAFSSANARVFAQSGNHDDCVAGGASLTAALLMQRRLFIGHVGESRAYLFRNGIVSSITEDDALAFDPPRNTRPVIPVEPPHRTLLTRTLGTQPTLEATVIELELEEHDELVVCTDGIHRHVNAATLGASLARGETAAEAVSIVLRALHEADMDEVGTIVLARSLDAPAATLDSSPETCERIRRAATIAGIVSLVVVAIVLILVYGIHV